jgi:AraC family transcriptional activator FtrA
MMSQPPKIVLVAYDGLQLFEFASALELLQNPPPDCTVPWYRLSTASVDGHSVTLPHGPTMGVDGSFALLADADILVIPGWPDREVDPVVADAVRAAHARGCRIVSICTGAFVLAEAGLLAARRATTHWRYVARFHAIDPTIVYDDAVLYIDDGDVITSAGAAAGIDMLLHMIRRDLGSTAANLAARGMVVAGHREGGQGQFVSRAVSDPEDDRLARAMRFARANLCDDLDVGVLASQAGMTKRTFFRRFQSTTGLTPHAWLMRERIAAARDLLERTDAPIEELANRSGFGTAYLLRHHFRRVMGVTPTSYRRSFGAAKPNSAPTSSRDGAEHEA